MKINGKRVLITGGSSGIGLALARVLLLRGAHVAISGRRPDVVAEAVRTLHSIGAAVHGIAADVATDEGRAATLELALSALGGLGVWVAGVPYAGVLTAILFIFCLAQLGPLLPLLASVAWLFMHDARLAAILLLVWSIGVTALDNILRPILIRRAIALPMILILAGVLGGLLAFGMIGLFIGPVLLAVTYALMLAWIDTQEAARAADNAPAMPDAPCAAHNPATHE